MVSKSGDVNMMPDYPRERRISRAEDEITIEHHIDDVDE